jgi:hypothetical protein
MTKEGIGRHLLQRNPKLYRSSGLPPFGDTELERQLGPFGSSPLATDKLEGTLHRKIHAISAIMDPQ